MLLKSSIIIKYIEHINYLSIPVSKVYFTIVCMCVCLPVCLYMGRGVPAEAREGIRPSRAGATSSCEPPNMYVGH